MKDRHALNTLHLGVAVMLLVGLLVAGCASRDAAVPAGTGAGDPAGLGTVLVFAGNWGIYLGVAALVISIIGLVVSFTPFGAFLAVFRTLLSESAIIGGITSLIGSVVAWVGVHSWLLYVVAAAAALTYAYRHRCLWLPMCLAFFKHAK